MTDPKRGFEWLEGRETLFGTGADAHLDVPGQRPHSIDTFACAYRRAAQTLFDAVIARGRWNDFDLFPLAFLWRQYLELTLKSLVMKDRDLRCESISHPHRHELMPLWEALEPSVRARWPEAIEQDYVRRVIAEFERVDPSSFDFRYPTAKAGAATRAQLPEWVNIQQLDQTMRALANVLDGTVADMMHAIRTRDSGEG